MNSKLVFISSFLIFGTFILSMIMTPLQTEATTGNQSFFDMGNITNPQFALNITSPASSEPVANTTSLSPPASSEPVANTTSLSPPASSEPVANTTSLSPPASSEPVANTTSLSPPASSEPVANTTSLSPPASSEPVANTTSAKLIAVPNTIMTNHFIAQVYIDKNFTGNSTIITKNTPILSGQFQDSISSLIITTEGNQTDGNQTTGYMIEVCEHKSYAGNCMILGPGKHNVQTLGWLNDQISSIRALSPQTLDLKNIKPGIITNGSN